jgi:hypothetical protein
MSKKCEGLMATGVGYFRRSVVFRIFGNPDLQTVYQYSENGLQVLDMPRSPARLFFLRNFLAKYRPSSPQSSGDGSGTSCLDFTDNHISCTQYIR